MLHVITNSFCIWHCLFPLIHLNHCISSFTPSWYWSLTLWLPGLLPFLVSVGFHSVTFPIYPSLSLLTYPCQSNCFSSIYLTVSFSVFNFHLVFSISNVFCSHHFTGSFQIFSFCGISFILTVKPLLHMSYDYILHVAENTLIFVFLVMWLSLITICHCFKCISVCSSLLFFLFFPCYFN